MVLQKHLESTAAPNVLAGDYQDEISSQKDTLGGQVVSIDVARNLRTESEGRVASVRDRSQGKSSSIGDS